MRFLITTFFIAIAAGIAGWFCPWWSVAVIAGIIALCSKLRTGAAALAGFWSIALLWGAFAIYHDTINNHYLTRKLAALFHLPNYITFIIATMLLGGITGALSAWAGAHLRKLFYPVPITKAS